MKQPADYTTKKRLPGSFYIRPGRPADWPGILSIAAETQAAHREYRPETFSGGAPYSQEFFQLLEQEEHCYYFVAADCSEETVLGYILLTLQHYSRLSMLRDRSVLMIDDLGVKQEYRRQGIGSLLYETALDLGHLLPADTAELSVWEFNQGARAFFAAMGMAVKSVELEQKLDCPDTKEK